MTLRNRLGLWLTAASLVPALILAIAAWFLYRSMTQRFALTPEPVAEQGSQIVDQHLLNARDRLKSIARYIEIPEEPDLDNPSAELLEASELLRVVNQMANDFSLLIVTDRDRVIYATESPQADRLGQIQGFMLPVQQILRDEPVFTPTRTFQATPKPSVAIWVQVAVPPSQDERLPRYFLSGLFDISQLREPLRQMPIEQNPQSPRQFLQLLDADGRELFNTVDPLVSADAEQRVIPPEAFATPEMETETETDAAATAEEPPMQDAEVAPDPQDAPAAQPAPSPEPVPPDFASAVAGSGLTDLKVRALIAPEVMATAHNTYWPWLLGILIGAGVIVGVLAFPAAYRALEPLYRILQGAKVWQGGDINYFFRGREKEGEWAELSESMNAIAARMQSMAFERPNRNPDKDLERISRLRPSPIVAEAVQVKALLRGATESDSEAVLIVTPAGKVLLANLRFHEIWGSDKSTIEHEGLGPLMRRALSQVQDRGAARGKLREMINNPEETAEAEFKLLDGRLLKYTTGPYSVGGQVEGRIWRFRDITVERRTENELRESQSLLDGLVANMPVALYLKDVRNEFRHVIWNQAAEELFGIPSDEAVGKTTTDLFPPHIAKTMTQTDMGAVQRGGVTELGEQNLTSRTRGSILVRMLKVPLYDEHGSPTHLICLAEDITRRTHTEQRLRREHSLLRGLVDSLPNIISFKTHTGVFLGCNKRFEDLVGKREQEIVGNLDSTLFEDADIALPPSIDPELLRDGRPRQRHSEIQLPGSDSVIQLETVETPLRGPNGDVWGVIGISRRTGAKPAAKPTNTEDL